MHQWPEPVRLAAHLLVDATTAWDHENPEAMTRGVLSRTLEGIGDTGAVEVLADEDGNVHVDVANLAFAGVVAIKELLIRLANAEGVDPAVVAVDLREFLDS